MGLHRYFIGMTRYILDTLLPPNIALDIDSAETQKKLHRLALKDLLKVTETKVIDGERVKVISANSYAQLQTGKRRYIDSVLPQEPVNGFTACSLFAGAGGSALGLEKAGYSISGCYELDKTASATLQANRPHWDVTQADITQTDFTHLRGRIDVLEGGFPCQPFSYAGGRAGFADTRGTLFHHYLRAVHEIEPKAFIAENVPGLLTNDKGRTWATIKEALEAETPQGHKYVIHYAVLKSHWLGIPQKRDRLIIVGIRDDQLNPAGFTFPEYESGVIPLKSALEGVPESAGVTYSAAKYEIMRQVPEGGNWKDLPEELQRELTNGKGGVDGSYSGTAKRLAWDEPSLTILASPAQRRPERCHPTETRPLTVREAARVQTFPDDWRFEGGVTAQYRQVGNAVPPRLASLVGKSLLKHLRK